MIDIKNRSRETRTYQYTREVSAGPVRPQVLDVVRGKHNPKTGEVTVAPKQITVGGVLTLPPKGELKSLPDVLLQHPQLKRDIESRAVSVKQHATAPAQPKPAPAEPKPEVTKTKVKSKKSRRG